jgi:arylsulfatase A-like enzyme
LTPRAGVGSLAAMKVRRRDFLVGSSAALGLAACRRGGSADDRPNILLLVSDQQRADWVGWNAELPLRTPHLERLAARGARFDRAYCPSPLCAPSRAALASGMEVRGAGVPDSFTSYPAGRPTFYAALRDAGYQVMSCGKLDLRKAGMAWGRDGQHMSAGRSLFAEWGFTKGFDSTGKHDGATAYAAGRIDPYYAYLEERGLAQAHLADMQRRGFPGYADQALSPLPDDAYADNWIAEQGLALLRQADERTPWFLQVNFCGPHEPMDVTAAMLAPWRDADFPGPYRNRLVPPELNLAVRRRYAAMIANLDRHLGRFVELLGSRGEHERTLVTWTSDHGEMLGDLDRWAKEVPYEPAIRVPLCCAGPGVRDGLVLTAPATILDLAATFLAVGRAAPLPGMESRDLGPVLAGERESSRAFVLSSLAPWDAVIERRFKLVRGFRPEETAQPGGATVEPLPDGTALYDLEADPHEEHDARRQHAAEFERLAALLPG